MVGSKGGTDAGCGKHGGVPSEEVVPVGGCREWRGGLRCDVVL